MGALTLLLAAALVPVYLASMWEAEPKRLIWHGGVAAVMLAYVVVSSGFELRDERLFFAGLAGAWLFGVLCHFLGIWARAKGWDIGKWRVPEVAGGVVIAIPLVLAVVGMLSPEAA